MDALRKVAVTIARVSRVRGMRRALKVAVGPELSALGLWPVDPSGLELIYHERQIIGVGAHADSVSALLDPGRHDEIVPTALQPYLARYVPPGANVLDVGSGPVSRLTGGHRQGRYTLTATDLLTEQYQQLLRLYGHGRVLEGVRYLACAGEALTEMLPNASFDFISINNALDHTDSPRVVVEQLTALTKPGGVVVVSGHSREGTFEQWKGMHQHDLWLEAGQIWRCGRGGADKMRLTADLPLEFVEGIEPANQHGDMLAVFKRLKR